MIIIKGKDIEYVPASHKDSVDPGALKKVLVKRGDIEEGRLQMINWSRMPVGKGFSLHYHEDMTEIFIILAGEVEITTQKSNFKDQSQNLKLKSENAMLNKGDVVVILPMEKHVMKNISDEDVFYIVMGIAHGEDGRTINCD